MAISAPQLPDFPLQRLIVEIDTTRLEHQVPAVGLALVDGEEILWAGAGGWLISARIGERARKDSKLVFTSLYHHVSDVDNLRACYDALPGDWAVGVMASPRSNTGKISKQIFRNCRGG
ncbi:MAG: hypothetical protein GY807_05760 [Gammaproteobacteria bacterium]|nr:hypothetical protein [Gammaproteobacteria bacterium]